MRPVSMSNIRQTGQPDIGMLRSLVRSDRFHGAFLNGELSENNVISGIRPTCRPVESYAAFSLPASSLRMM
jgi:hypothetical protein